MALYLLDIVKAADPSIATVIRSESMLREQRRIGICSHTLSFHGGFKMNPALDVEVLSLWHHCYFSSGLHCLLSKNYFSISLPLPNMVTLPLVFLL